MTAGAAGLTVLLTLSLGPGLGDSGLQCPKYCSCMWRRGKEAVVCRDTRFTQIPANIDPNTQVMIVIMMMIVMMIMMKITSTPSPRSGLIIRQLAPNGCD